MDFDRPAGRRGHPFEISAQAAPTGNCEADMESLSDLFEDGLKDIYYAEKSILKALPKMIKKAQSEDLAAAFEKHPGRNRRAITLLEEAFNAVGKKPQSQEVPCH